MRQATEAPKLPFDREGFAEVSEVAEFMGLSTTTVYALCNSGELPSGRFGKAAIRIPRKAVVEYVDRKLRGE